jgi:hypothetical protein
MIAIIVGIDEPHRLLALSAFLYQLLLSLKIRQISVVLRGGDVAQAFNKDMNSTGSIINFMIKFIGLFH